MGSIIGLTYRIFERELEFMPFKVIEGEVLDARTVERFDALEARIGRFEESVKFVMPEFRQALKIEMEKLFGNVPMENLSSDEGVLPIAEVTADEMKKHEVF